MTDARLETIWLMATSGTSVHAVYVRTVDDQFPSSVCGIRELSRIRTTRRRLDGKVMNRCRRCETYVARIGSAPLDTSRVGEWGSD